MVQSIYKFIPFKEITNSGIYVQQLKLLYPSELCLLRSVTDVYCDPLRNSFSDATSVGLYYCELKLVCSFHLTLFNDFSLPPPQFPQAKYPLSTL